MSEFPKRPPFKMSKCPECGGAFHEAVVEHHDDRVVRAVCPNESCEYTLDLFWMGEAAAA